jgi:transcriptional regulator with XRE-family HTH domain
MQVEDIFTRPNVHSSKRFVVPTERTHLAEMLWKLKESGDGLSLSKMAARSGGLVAVSTLHNVMTGKTRELTPDTIAGLAKILGVSEGHVLAALNDRQLAREEEHGEEFARLWQMYSDIPRACQKDVMDLITALWGNHSLSRRRERLTEYKGVVMSEREDAPEGEEAGEDLPLFGGAVHKPKPKRKAHGGAAPDEKQDGNDDKLRRAG